MIDLSTFDTVAIEPKPKGTRPMITFETRASGVLRFGRACRETTGKTRATPMYNKTTDMFALIFSDPKHSKDAATLPFFETPGKQKSGCETWSDQGVIKIFRECSTVKKNESESKLTGVRARFNTKYRFFGEWDGDVLVFDLSKGFVI